MDLNYGNDSFDVESKEIELLILIKMDIIKNRSIFLWYRLRGDHSSEKKMSTLLSNNTNHSKNRQNNEKK